MKTKKLQKKFQMLKTHHVIQVSGRERHPFFCYKFMRFTILLENEHSIWFSSVIVNENESKSSW